MRLKVCLFLLLTALVATACDSAPPPKAAKPAKPLRQAATIATPPAKQDIPLGQLPDHVEPLHYSLDLMINPDQLRYEGTVAIDVDLKAPKREFYLHGRDLVVSRITATLSDRTVVNGTIARSIPPASRSCLSTNRYQRARYLF